MPTTTPSTSSMSSSCSSVLVHDQPGSKPGSSSDDQPFTVVKPKGRRKPNHPKPIPLSQPSPDSHTLLLRPKDKAASLETADFPVLLSILSALGALLPARWIRGGGLAVDFTTSAAMDAAASISALAGVPVRASKPVQHACRTGVVSGVPPGLSPSAFISEAAADNPSLLIHRAQRLGNPASSRTMKVVFVGSSLPSNLKFRFRSHQIRPFEMTARKPLQPEPDARKLTFSAAPPAPRNQPQTAPKKNKLSFSAALKKTTPHKRKLPFSDAHSSSPPSRRQAIQLTELTVRAALEPQEPPRSSKPAPPLLTEAATQTEEVVIPVPQETQEQPSCSDAANQTDAVTVPATQTPEKPSQRQECLECYSHLQPTPIYESIVGEAYLRGKTSQGWKADLAFLLQFCTRLAAAPADVNQLTVAAGQDPKFPPKPPKGKGKR